VEIVRINLRWIHSYWLFRLAIRDGREVLVEACKEDLLVRIEILVLVPTI
jgi:hypothetical protein